MAGRSLPGNRTRTSLDQERENFEKSQTLAISKAVNEIEVPVKTKHVRVAIMGTFQEKGSHIFWAIIHRLPIHANPIVAWKFSNTLHKLLREGHPNVLRDSQRHREFLVENGKLWGLIKEGYGKLIFLYYRLLVVKLDFHRRNPRFPGTLVITDDELELICENDVNLYFQLSVELLDYMDEILNLQSAIFGSLDMSRSNSMTNAGQCRLAPLIPCIQDSSQVYDFIVKLLFKLHNCLPAETLEGHRLRFMNQFKALKQFYNSSRTLQYFKTLIQVPHLDENPPNFLVSSELSRHVTPVVIVPEPAPQPADVALVEFAEPETDRNGSASPDLLQERDRYIEHLLHQIEQLSAEMNQIRADYQRKIGHLRQQLAEMESRLAEKELEVQEALKGKEEIERKLSEAAQSAQTGSLVQLQLQESEQKAKTWEDKFVKLKEVYHKLREEHIALLRQKADADKKLSVANAALEQSTKIQKELYDTVESAKRSADEASSHLQALNTSHDLKAQQLSAENESLQEDNRNLKTSVSDLEREVQLLSTKLAALQEEKMNLSGDLESSNIAREQNSRLIEELEQSVSCSNAKNDELNALVVNQAGVIAQLEKEADQLKTNTHQLQENLAKAHQQVESIQAENSQILVEKSNLAQEFEAQTLIFQTTLNKNQLELFKLFQQLLVDCAMKAEQYMDKCVVDLSKPPIAAMSIQDQSGISAQGAFSILEALRQSLHVYLSSANEQSLCHVIPIIFPFAQSIGYFILQSQQLAHSLPDIEQADQVLSKCLMAGKTAVLFFRGLQQPFDDDRIDAISKEVEIALRELHVYVDSLVESMKANNDKDNVGQELENELSAMERAIVEAADRIAKLWENSKRSQTGVKLEVNEKVLDSCTALMKAIMELIKKAKQLQEEIVVRGKGSASAKEFYKRNHRWTEGLLSAAKAVGFGAKLLTDAADKVVQGQAKFEQLTVASQEIAASTAQLVFASRVKADMNSKNLQALAEASKAVSTATGGVVATAKHCAGLVEDSTVLDFAHLTLHQAKRLEMESQVKVLEFESSLEKERLRLSALRRQHYQLAGESQE